MAASEAEPALSPSGKAFPPSFSLLPLFSICSLSSSEAAWTLIPGTPSLLLGFLPMSVSSSLCKPILAKKRGECLSLSLLLSSLSLFFFLSSLSLLSALFLFRNSMWSTTSKLASVATLFGGGAFGAALATTDDPSTAFKICTIVPARLLSCREGQIESAQSHLFFAPFSDASELRKLQIMEDCFEGRRFCYSRFFYAEALLKLHQLDEADSALSNIPKFEPSPPS